MNKTSKLALALATGASLGLATLTASAAGSMAGQLNAQMVMQSGCIISGAPGAGTSGVSFGALDFGSQPSTFVGVLTASATGGAGGAGATQIVCSTDITAMTISVSGGNNAGQGSAIGTGGRAMKLGTTNFMPYDVYNDSGLTVPYPTAATSLGVVLPGTGAPFTLPIYGRVNKTSVNAMASGTYTDVLQVTLSW